MARDQTVGDPQAGRLSSPGAGAATVAPPAREPAAASPETPSQQEYARILLIAAILGIPAAFAAAIFMSLIHGVTLLLWTTIPEAFGWKSPATWYVLAIPTLGGLAVAGALRLPGHGGESPVGGIAFEPLSPIQAGSALLAALITLGSGLVLGPEAPLVVLGTTTGLVATGMLKPGASGGQILIIAGAFATISTLFGGPLPSALLLLELLAFSGRVPSVALIPAILPGFLASGTAALIFTGIDKWPGVHLNTLSLPSLPNYPTVRIADIIWCILLALVVAVLVAGARLASQREAARAVALPPVALLVGAGFTVGLLAVIFRAITGQSVNLVLFSGETALSPIVAETSAGVLLLLVLCKGAGYILSLGSGFRGGPTFPACALGIALGVCAHIVLPGLDLTPAVIAGLAAGASAALDLGIFGALLATVMGGAAATEAIPIAVIASVIGWLVATAAKTREGGQAAEPAGSPASSRA